MSRSIQFKVVIPARYGSTRLPGKPLRLIAGKPMVEHVYRRALDAEAAEVIVATDDSRILETVEAFGGQVMMTSAVHVSGTDRLAEVAERKGWADESIVVNLQGDEPMMAPSLIKKVAKDLVDHPSAGMATLGTVLTSREELFDPNVVKAVTDHNGMALYFSRAPIPWVRDEFANASDLTLPLPAGIPFYRHLGMYAYRADVLRRFPTLAPCVLETSEALEQNRALFYGIGIHLSVSSEVPGHGVDTEEDLHRVEKLLLGGSGSGLDI